MADAILSPARPISISSADASPHTMLTAGIGLTLLSICSGATVTNSTASVDVSGTALVAQADAFRERFSALATAWRSDMARSVSSSFADMVSNWAYLRIIGMGPPAIPLILEELARSPHHWGPALEAITGANPIPDDIAGNVPAIAAAWLNWGRQHNQIV